MSSKEVRDDIKDFLTNELPLENVVELTNETETLEDVLNSYGLDYKSKWLGIQFIGSDEIPVSVVSNNVTGKYRETGALFLHIVEPARNSARDDILTRATSIINKFRGQNINGIYIDSVTPPNYEASATLQFDGGFTSASVIVNYRRDRSL